MIELTVTLPDEAPANGRLGGDSAFVISLNGTNTAVVVTAASQSTNSSRNDLATDYNDALTAAGIGGQVTVEFAGNKLRFRVTDPAITSFNVSFTSPPTVTLGAPASGKYAGSASIVASISPR